MHHPFSKKIPLVYLITAAIGFLDAAYLTAKHYLGGPIPCLTGGCELVTTSEYAYLVGIPVALLGAIYYFSQLILVIAYYESKSFVPLKLAAQLSIVGLLASVYFVSLQLFIIQSICQYCMLSAATSTTLFILGLHIQKRLKAHITQ